MGLELRAALQGRLGVQLPLLCAVRPDHAALHAPPLLLAAMHADAPSPQDDLNRPSTPRPRARPWRRIRAARHEPAPVGLRPVERCPLEVLERFDQPAQQPLGECLGGARRGCRRAPRWRCADGARSCSAFADAGRILGIDNPFFPPARTASPAPRPRSRGARCSLGFLQLPRAERRPRVLAAAEAAMRRYRHLGFGQPAGLRRAAGARGLEGRLAELHATEDCIAMSAGTRPQSPPSATVVGAGDAIVHDALAHNSVLQGACAVRRHAGRSRTTTWWRWSGRCSRYGARETRAGGGRGPLQHGPATCPTCPS